MEMQLVYGKGRQLYLDGSCLIVYMIGHSKQSNFGIIFSTNNIYVFSLVFFSYITRIWYEREIIL